MGAIGCKNALPWRLKSDMRFFRETTTGHTVLMGRKTYESVGGCLPKRNNVVLSHNAVLFASSDKCKLALSIPEALFVAQKFGSSETFVIGGALTYHQFGPFIDRYLVTLIDHEVEHADAFLDQNVLNDIETWERSKILECDASADGDDHRFVVYEVSAPDKDARRLVRSDLIEQYKSSLPKALKRQNGKPSRPSRLQEAFAF